MTPDYWLDHCTVQDWTAIWAKELIETPPADEWAAIDRKHAIPDEGADAEAAEPELWDCPYPDVTE